MKPRAPFDAGMQLLSKVLDLRAQNQQVIASNIANAETPGYSARKFNFEDELRRVLRGNEGLPLAQTHKKHLPLGPRDIDSVRGSITIHPDTTGIGDQNSVSVDSEMIALSENEILYEAAVQLLQKKAGMIQQVLSSGQ